MIRLPRTLALGLGLAVLPGVAPAQEGAKGETYWTEVTLEESSCDKVTVMPGETLITRNGADSVTVSHANQTYAGTLSTGGEFTTSPRDLVFGTTTYTIAISGRLEGDGLAAVVTVGVREAGADQSCRYRVRWVGRKQ